MQSLSGLQSGEYYGAKKVKISCGLTKVPQEIFSLSDTLEILDLSGNPISKLPEDFGRLDKLKVAFFSDCNFEVFPEQLVRCPSLEMIAFKSNRMTMIPEVAFPTPMRWLILTNNLIEVLPKSIGNCHRLQKCMLAGNRLTTLPEEMSNCKKLGLLRLSVNRIAKLPDFLFSLPELAFLAFAGNPCAPSFEDNPILDDISWSDLKVQELLGEGASGIISKGAWKAPGGEKEVAAKLFKGEITSDGSPIDEMNACITAGSHPNLIDPIGKIHGHPDKRGLVLQLIPSSFKSLGLPPTLQTCTRDVYPTDMILSYPKVKNILLSIASAAAHLHSKGMSHGDLYAHNILIDETGNALLGDYGGATIYRRDHASAMALERLEILAFAHLIEDMIGLIEKEDKRDSFQELHKKCTKIVVSERPSFVEICEELKRL